jgi:hypothetical protein
VAIFLAVLTGGGLAAGGGLLTGLLNNWLGGKRDERTHAHEQHLAREARRQDRRERTYMDLGIYLSRQQDWARSRRPFLHADALPPLPPEERWRIQTAVTLYGSKEVQGLLDQFDEQVMRIESADLEIAHNADQVAELDPELEQDELRGREAYGAALKMRLDDAAVAMFKAVEAIRARMWAELDGGPEPSAAPAAGLS